MNTSRKYLRQPSHIHLRNSNFRLSARILLRGKILSILVAPTGFGKSFIYQVAPFLYDSKYTLPSVNRTRRTNTIREQTFGSNVTTDVSSLSGFTSLSESRENGESQLSETVQPTTGGSTSTSADTSNTIEDDAKPTDTSTPTRPERGDIPSDNVDNLSGLLAETTLSATATSSTIMPTASCVSG